MNYESPPNYNFPPIYNFPPFFTYHSPHNVSSPLLTRRRQPNEKTWLKQCELWSTLLLDYAAHFRQFELEASPEALSSPPFTNQAINRKLSAETLRSILDQMVAQGDAAWLHPKGKRPNKELMSASSSSRCLLFWRKPSAWAELIYNYVVQHGMIGSIVTAYELFESDDASRLEFHKLPESIWRRALTLLEESGKAKMFESEESNNSLEIGIKFF